MRVDAEQLDAGELVDRIGLDILLEGDRRRFALGHHEGQLEDFRLGEAARRVAEHGPDQVDDAVLGLVVEVRRRAAELHGRIELELEPAARCFLDPLGPWLDGLARDRRLRRQHLMHAQRGRVLRPNDRRSRQGKSSGGGAGQECTSLHSHPPLVLLTIRPFPGHENENFRRSHSSRVMRLVQECMCGARLHRQ